jgi:hypothetical protein
MTYLVQFPPSVIALRQELEFHPDLCKQLYSLGPSEQGFPEQLAVIATYCDVLLDGNYSLEDIANICAGLVVRLQKKRTIVVM